MSVRRLNHAVLYVHDLASAVDFYTGALGFEVRTEIPGRAAFLRAPGSANDHDLGLFDIGGSPQPPGPRVGLYAPRLGGGARSPTSTRHAVGSPTRGALVGASDHRVSKSLYARDPSGIEFEVMWRVPAEDWAAELAAGRHDRAARPRRGAGPLGRPRHRRRRRLRHLTGLAPSPGGRRLRHLASVSSATWRTVSSATPTGMASAT